MKWYACDVADMKVSLFCNGLDNLLDKTGYEFYEEDDYSDADVLIVYSAKQDKAVNAVTDTLSKEGSVATLKMAVYTEAASADGFFDLTLVCGEAKLSGALEALLKLIDYYNYIQPIDIGYELSDRGLFRYEGGVDAVNPASVVTTVAEALSDREEGILLLEVGEDVWISDVQALCEALSESTGEKRLTVAPIRTLSGERIRCSLLKK